MGATIADDSGAISAVGDRVGVEPKQFSAGGVEVGDGRNAPVGRGVAVGSVPVGSEVGVGVSVAPGVVVGYGRNASVSSGVAVGSEAGVAVGVATGVGIAVGVGAACA